MPDESLLRAVLYIVGILSSPAFFIALWKAAMFFAKAITKLDKIDSIEATVSALRHARNNDAAFEVSISLSLIEPDINVLQEKVGVPVRTFPDRRTGPADRRHA